MDPTASGALGAADFSALAIFMKSDWVVKGVLIFLVLASLWSWAVIIDKWLRISALNRYANRFEDAVASGRPLEEVAAEAGERPTPRPAAHAAGGAEGVARGPGARRDLVGDAERAPDLAHRPGAGLDHRAREPAGGGRAWARWPSSPPRRPSSGLFGTVWGIMNAFQAIAIQKNTNLSVVAPSIAEALFATAVGLIAAIPAYIFYNKFSTDAGKFAARLEGFADDLSTAVARRVAERAGS